MKKTGLTGLILGFALAATTATPGHAQQEGAALLEERCSVCHPAARPKSAQKSMEQWDATVTRMLGKGARLTAEEKDLLLEHLSANYKP